MMSPLVGWGARLSVDSWVTILWEVSLRKGKKRQRVDGGGVGIGSLGGTGGGHSRRPSLRGTSEDDGELEATSEVF